MFIFCISNLFANKVLKIDYLKLSNLSYTFNLKFLRLDPKTQMHFSADVVIYCIKFDIVTYI